MPEPITERELKKDASAQAEEQKKDQGMFAGFNRWKESTQKSFQEKMPQWARDNSTQIVNAGLLFFTSVMIASAFRGKAISRHIHKAQEALLQKAGFEGEALAVKIKELEASKAMKPPRLHRQRMIYLGTAITSFALGAFIKKKPETKEDRETYDKMSLPEYMATRVKESFDPMNHTRQSVGLLGATSGALAIISALSQPGGKHWSEMVVGGTLLSGFSALIFMKDPANAQQTFSTCWWMRLPVVVTGTYESVFTRPEFKHPLSGAKLHLPIRRMDISYPIGQWGNMAFAAFGFLMAGSDEKKKLEATIAGATSADKPDLKVHQAQKGERISEQATAKAHSA